MRAVTPARAAHARGASHRGAAPARTACMSRRPPRVRAIAALSFVLALVPGAFARTVDFAGYTWEVREGGGGPGPNRRSADNVRVAADGLHLRIAGAGGQWTCAEV